MELIVLGTEGMGGFPPFSQGAILMMNLGP